MASKGLRFFRPPTARKKGGHALNRAKVGCRLFCDAAREYLEAQDNDKPTHEELAVQLVEVNKLNRSAGKAEVTKKQLDRSYWKWIRAFGQTVEESTAAAEEHGVQTKMRGVTLACHQQARFGYVGVRLHHSKARYVVDFRTPSFRALTNAGYSSFGAAEPEVCAYARALASMIVDGDESAWEPLKELYSEHYSESPKGRAFLRKKGMPLAAEYKQFEAKQSASKKPAAAKRASKTPAPQKSKATVHGSEDDDYDSDEPWLQDDDGAGGPSSAPRSPRPQRVRTEPKGCANHVYEDDALYHKEPSPAGKRRKR